MAIKVLACNEMDDHARALGPQSSKCQGRRSAQSRMTTRGQGSVISGPDARDLISDFLAT